MTVGLFGTLLGIGWITGLTLTWGLLNPVQLTLPGVILLVWVGPFGR